MRTRHAPRRSHLLKMDLQHAHRVLWVLCILQEVLYKIIALMSNKQLMSHSNVINVAQQRTWIHVAKKNNEVCRIEQMPRHTRQVSVGSQRLDVKQIISQLAAHRIAIRLECEGQSTINARIRINSVRLYIELKIKSQDHNLQVYVLNVQPKK